MEEKTFLEKQEETISVHIFSVSAAMVGACLTTIGIINIVTSFSKVKTFADDLTAFGAIVFLISCAVSFFGIKTKERKRRLLLEKISDVVFMVGLVILAMVCVLIVHTLG